MSVSFDLGRVVATPAALAALERVGQTPLQLLARHVAGDWGELDEQDRVANEEALVTGVRLLSVYPLTDEVTVWIITDGVAGNGRRPSTCILLPVDY